ALQRVENGFANLGDFAGIYLRQAAKYEMRALRKRFDVDLRAGRNRGDRRCRDRLTVFIRYGRRRLSRRLPAGERRTDEQRKDRLNTEHFSLYHGDGPAGGAAGAAGTGGSTLAPSSSLNS